MSQAERRARQQEQAGQQAAALLRQRQALAPKPIAVLVAAAYGYFLPLWRTTEHSRIALDGYLGVQRHTYLSARSNA